MVATRGFLTTVVASVLTIGLTCCGTRVQKPDGRVVLPNIKLTGCDAPSCSLIWPEKSSAANAGYPKQVSIDLDNGSVRAVMAVYDQSVPMDEIRGAVDQRYGRWALATSDPNSHMRLWRVEPEKFAISLFEDKDGTKSLFYLAFRPNAEVYQDMMKAMVPNPSDCGTTTNEQIGTADLESAITGRVTDSEGAAIAKARVVVHWDPSGSAVGLKDNVGIKQDVMVVTDASGYYSASVPPGFYDVFVSAGAFTPTATKVRVKQGQRGTFGPRLNADPLVTKELGHEIYPGSK